MSTFQYEALTKDERLMKGTIEAADAQQAREHLADMLLSVTTLEKLSRQIPQSRIGRTEFMLFNQQLASIAKAGIPLERGLKELAEEIRSKSMQKLVWEIADDLESGMDIVDAFNRRKDLFPPLYAQVLWAGVQSGRLGDMLTSLNRHLESSRQTRRILVEILSYPVVVLVLAAVLSMIVFRVVIVQLEGLYLDMGFDLPEITHYLLVAANHIYEFWAIVGIFILSLIMIHLALGRIPEGRRFRESILRHIPLLGHVYHRSILARFADALALLVSAGNDMPTCLSLAAATTGSECMKQECYQITQWIENGENIQDFKSRKSLVPPLFLYAIQLGSQRNELEDNLYNLADMYTEQVATSQMRLQSLIPPILLIFVGGFVGLNVIAILYPLIKMLNMVQ